MFASPSSLFNACKDHSFGIVGSAGSWFAAITASHADLEFRFKIATYVFAMVASAATVVGVWRKDRREAAAANGK